MRTRSKTRQLQQQRENNLSKPSASVDEIAKAQDWMAKKRKGTDETDPIDQSVVQEMLIFFHKNEAPSVKREEVVDCLSNHIGREGTAFSIVKDSLWLGLSLPQNVVIDKLMNMYLAAREDLILEHMQSAEHRQFATEFHRIDNAAREQRHETP